MSEARRKNTTRYFVGGIAVATLETAISRYFETCGLSVLKVEVKRGKHTKLSKGFAFVTTEKFAREAAFLTATHFIEGREVTVSISPPKSKSESSQSNPQPAPPRSSGPTEPRLQAQQLRLGKLEGPDRPQSMGDFGQQSAPADRSRGSEDPELPSDWLPRPSHQTGKVASLKRLAPEKPVPRLAPGSVFDRQSASFKVFDQPFAQQPFAPAFKLQKSKHQIFLLRLPGPESSNKHHKYEYLHSSTRMNEHATNYRFNVLSSPPVNLAESSADREQGSSGVPESPRSRFDLRKAFQEAISFDQRVDSFLPSSTPLTSWLASEEARHPENL